MTVKTIAEAWKKANELFPTDYMKDEDASQRAGYPSYYSTSSEHADDHINDLNDRLELVIGGSTQNIWIQEVLDMQQAPQKVTMSHALYRDIWMLIGAQVDKAKHTEELYLEILDGLDQSDPENMIELKNTVLQIRGARETRHKYEAMLEQFEKEVEE